MYLDCDTSPPIKSKHSRTKTIEFVVEEAKLLLRQNPQTEGQIGIYDKAFSQTFYGYVIKYRNAEPYFEPASEEVA